MRKRLDSAARSPALATFSAKRMAAAWDVATRGPSLGNSTCKNPGAWQAPTAKTVASKASNSHFAFLSIPDLGIIYKTSCRKGAKRRGPSISQEALFVNTYHLYIL
jgi:hypothetical protein